MSVAQRVICVFVSTDKEAALSVLQQLSGGPFDIVMVDRSGIAPELDDCGYSLQVIEVDGDIPSSVMDWVAAKRPECKGVWFCKDGMTGMKQADISTLYATLSATRQALIEHEQGVMLAVDPSTSDAIGVSAESKNRILHVLMPSRGMISVPSHVFLSNYNVWGNRAGFGQVHQHIPTGLSVAEAREQCLGVVEQWMDNMPDYEHWILWMDDDMAPPTNSVADLRIALESESRIGIISGYCCRKEDHDPGLVFAPKTKAPMLPLVDFTPGEIVEVEWCGLGFALMKAHWIKQMPTPRFKPNWGGAEEDHNFTIDLRNLGCTPFMHTGISVGHFSTQNQSTYFPYIQPAVRAASNGKEEHPQAVAAGLGDKDA